MSKVAVFSCGTDVNSDREVSEVFIFPSLEEAKGAIKDWYLSGEIEEPCMSDIEIYQLGKPKLVKLDVKVDIS